MPKTPTHELTRTAFLRALAGVYLIAFVSLWVQVDGLIGPDGITPVAGLLRQIGARAPSITGLALLDRLWAAPTLAWWLPEAWAGWLLCLAGAGCAVAALIAARQGPWLLGCFVAYLSLGTICQPWLGFQWDTLLCEVGFASLLLARWRAAPAAAVPAAVWLQRWILFRLMFFAGVVKLTSGDTAWWDGTALGYHYETQPLPNPISRFAHQLPMAWHRVETLVTFVVELVLVWLIIGPPRARAAAFGATAGLMVLLMFTGNYGFFQLLTLALALALLDDDHWRRALPAAWTKVKRSPPASAATTRAVQAGAAMLVLASLIGMPPRYLNTPVPGPLESARAALSRWRIVNHYGLFARMTRTRPIPVLEARWGDGEWTELTWRWQTSDPLGAPPIVAPHMPRLDWQLWFAGLSTCDRQPWLRSLMQGVLDGDRPVTALIGDMRLEGQPPDSVRLIRYVYRFAEAPADPAAWWTRQAQDELCPAMSRAATPR